MPQLRILSAAHNSICSNRTDGGWLHPHGDVHSTSIKAKKVRNQIIPSDTQEDAEQRKRDRKANLTFFIIFLSLFGVNIPPVLAFVVISMIFAPLGIQPPEALLLVLSLLQQLRTLLPVMDSIALMRNPEMRKAIKMLKNKLKGCSTAHHLQ